MKKILVAAALLLSAGAYAQSQPACCQKAGGATPSCSSAAGKTEASCHDKGSASDKNKSSKSKKATKSSKKESMAGLEQRVIIREDQPDHFLADVLRELPEGWMSGEPRFFF